MPLPRKPKRRPRRWAYSGPELSVVSGARRKMFFQQVRRQYSFTNLVSDIYDDIYRPSSRTRSFSVHDINRLSRKLRTLRALGNDLVSRDQRLFSKKIGTRFPGRSHFTDYEVGIHRAMHSGSTVKGWLYSLRQRHLANDAQLETLLKALGV